MRISEIVTIRKRNEGREKQSEKGCIYISFSLLRRGIRNELLVLREIMMCWVIHLVFGGISERENYPREHSAG